MFVEPIEHRFLIQNEPYVLKECGRGGQERWRREFALAIAPAPGVLDSIDGINILAQAVARQCLDQAPDVFWKKGSTPTERHTARMNGHLWEFVSFEAVGLAQWEAFRKEVDEFISRLPQPQPANPPTPSQPGAGNSDAVAAPEAVSPMFRGEIR